MSAVRSRHRLPHFAKTRSSPQTPRRGMHSLMQLVSVISCPICGHKASETMPTDVCQFFYDCEGCGTRLKPKPGDCCVFCSYGSVPCPPVQAQRRGGTGCCGLV